MTVQELIVGHYEGSLTSLEEKQLQKLLQTSGDARSLYEQHGAMQEAMEEESERLVPPIALREATIGAALGIAAESLVGGGIGAWFTTKVAIAIGTVIVGGAAVGVVLSTGGDDKPNKPTTTVTTPAQANETSVPSATPSVEATSPATATPNTQSPARPANAVAATASRSGGKRGTTSATDKQGPSGVGMKLGNEPPVNIPTSPTVTPKGNK